MDRVNLNDTVTTAIENLPVDFKVSDGARERVVERVWAERPGSRRELVNAVVAALRLERVHA